jgi:hypothetical protein
VHASDAFGNGAMSGVYGGGGLAARRLAAIVKDRVLESFAFEGGRHLEGTESADAESDDGDESSEHSSSGIDGR